MTKDEFTRRWRHKLAGLALYGAVSDVKDGPMTRAAKVWDIPAEVERLLAMMFDDLTPKPPEKPGDKK